ncbi:alpha/beta hydrolase [Amycolatopsis sp. NPDC059657]|uniref:alpha/beta hydrolase n=1 Tax=Amycolatopsis sp. NPDC059657 TaxID=3346899 RepID=UPI003670755B
MHASDIRLDSTFGLILVAVLALLAVIAVPWFWDSWKWRRTGRSTTTVTAVILVVVSMGLAGNMIGGFFPTLGALIGTSNPAGEGTNGEGGLNGGGLEQMKDYNRDRGAKGLGSTFHLTVLGDRTGLTRDVNLYIPPQYYDPAYEGFTFPVIEWIPNYPSGPEVAGSGYKLFDQLDAAIGKKLMPPTVVIIPDPTGVPKVGHDTECVDEVNGAANDTYLTADIRAWALKTLKVSADRKSWAIAGWSSGGYCALNLVTRHPQWFGIAASVSGYDAAWIDAETTDIFKGRKDIADANNVSINLAKHPSPVDLLAIAGDKEGNEVASIQRMNKAALSPTTFTSWIIPDAGHNMNTFKSQLPDVLTWIGSKSATPRFSGARKVTVSGEVKPWPLPQTGAKGALVATDQ